MWGKMGGGKSLPEAANIAKKVAKNFPSQDTIATLQIDAHSIVIK